MRVIATEPGTEGFEKTRIFSLLEKKLAKRNVSKVATLHINASERESILAWRVRVSRMLSDAVEIEMHDVELQTRFVGILRVEHNKWSPARIADEASFLAKCMVEAQAQGKQTRQKQRKQRVLLPRPERPKPQPPPFVRPDQKPIEADLVKRILEDEDRAWALVLARQKK